MMLRMTAKALSLVGRDRITLTSVPAGDDDWYLNLLWIDRRKCLLITHATTLFTVFAANVRASEIRPIGRYVGSLVRAALRAEALPGHCLGLLDPDRVSIGKTASRQVLAFMNDIAREARFYVADAGGLSRCDIPRLNCRLRRGLHDRGGYASPMDLVAERLGRTDGGSRPEADRRAEA